MTLHDLPDGRKLSYRVIPAAAPNGKAILLANSLSTSYPIWDDVVALLTSAPLNFTVICFDFPGHGASTAPADLKSTTFPSMADDVAHLVKGLEARGIISLPFFAWIGVSMGAATALFFATRHPGLVQRLVLCDTISCSPTHAGVEDVFLQRVADARKDGNMDRTVGEALEIWFGDRLPEEKRAWVRGIMEAGATLDGFETCCAALSHDSFDVRPLAPKVAESGVGKVLVVVGEKDANLPETMAELRANIEKGYKEKGLEGRTVMHVIPESGHLPFVDAFDRFVVAVVPFLQ